MEVEEDYQHSEPIGADELLMDNLEDGAYLGADDLVEYSAGEEEQEESLVYIKTEETVEEIVPRSVINSPNITVKRVINSKPATTATVQRFVPKPTNLIRNVNAGGKVMLIQKPTTSGVKLLNNTRKITNNANTTSYHLVKSDSNVTMRPKLPTAQTMVRRVVSTSDSPSQKMLMSTPKHVVIHTKTANSGTTTKTVTVAEAQQMGLLNNKMKQMVAVGKSKALSKHLPTTSTNSVSSSAMMRLKQSPGGQAQKVLIKAGQTIPQKTSVQTQKVLLPQSAISAGQQTGQIQAINIPGKGIQYVRFLNQPSSSGGSQKVVQMVNKATGAPPGSKIIVQNNKTYVVSNGNVSVRGTTNQLNRTGTAGTQTVMRKAVVSSGNSKEPAKETTRYIAVVRKEDGKSSSDVITTLSSSQLNHLKGTTVMAGGAKTKIVMLPTDHPRPSKLGNTSAGGGGAALSNPPTIISVKRESVSGSEDEIRKGPSAGTSIPDEAYKKRPCNCTKSQCLKLYCDCFANGEFCYNCNCRDCFNNLDNEEERQKAIRATLERNPSAFKPKIGAVSAAEDALRQHTKGCNCKRSGCLKNYCECYEAKIPCSSNCKCIGCRNTEQYAKEFEYATGVGSSAAGDSSGGIVAAGTGSDPGQQSGDDSMTESGTTSASISAPGPSVPDPVAESSIAGVKRTPSTEPDLTQLPPSKQPYNFMTPDVIEATVQCMIAQADECQKRGCNSRTAERMILEEFGRCLVEIIEFSTKSDS